MGKVSSNAAAVSRPGKRFHCSRRWSKLVAGLVKPHNQHVGDVIHAYNSAHAGLFILFWRLVANENYDLAISMWHTAKSDRSQRDLIEAFIANSTEIKKTYKNAILWSITSLNQLASFRNDAAHSEMIWYYDQLIPGLATKPSSQERLLKLPFERHWRKLKGDLIALSIYLIMIDMSISLNERSPSPKRPRLQLVRSTPEHTQKRRRLNKKEARERQRQASNTEHKI
jgi:hypothetical protein